MKGTMRLAAALVALFAVTACTRAYIEDAAVKDFLKKDPDAAGAIAAVRGYNKSLMLVYARNDADLLNDFATDREMEKVRRMVADFVAKGIRMDAELTQLRVEKLESWGHDNVIVTTRERWRYRRVYTVSGEEQKPLTEIKYHMVYNMTRVSGEPWKVFNLTPK